MRNFNLIILTLLLVITSCSTENTGIPGNIDDFQEKSLIGTWKIERIVRNGDQPIIVDNCKKLDTREFNSSKRFEFQYYMSGPDMCLDNGNEQGEWLIKNNVLVLKWDNNDEDDLQILRWPILKLSENELVLKIEYPESDEYPAGWYQEVGYTR